MTTHTSGNLPHQVRPPKLLISTCCLSDVDKENSCPICQTLYTSVEHKKGQQNIDWSVFMDHGPRRVWLDVHVVTFILASYSLKHSNIGNSCIAAVIYPFSIINLYKT